MRQFRFLAFVLFLFDMSTRTSFGDHLSTNLIARTKQEISLAGISIVKPYSSLSDIEAKWGSADKIDSPTGNECDRIMIWRRGTVIIKGSVGCEGGLKRQEHHFVVYTVEVLGKDAMRNFTTGRGLCLGDSFERVVTLYGSRLRVNKKSDGAREITIQWRTGAELNASINGLNQVSRIQLLPLVE